jgi:regulation of enolase protein 1 (concanavalin A-like superfamily)
MAFKYANSSDTPPSANATSFQLTTPAQTDIFRKPGPPLMDVFNAPILYKSIPLSKFQRVRVTISASWESLYDQGGLIFVLPNSSEGTRKWIKSGIEFFHNEVYMSTVVCDRWADWNMLQVGVKNGNQITLQMEREIEHGGQLWIYVIDGEKKIPIREVTWFLSEGDEKELWVGTFVARPTEAAEGKEQSLAVEFKDWELDVV